MREEWVDGERIRGKDKRGEDKTGGKGRREDDETIEEETPEQGMTLQNCTGKWTWVRCIYGLALNQPSHSERRNRQTDAWTLDTQTRCHQYKWGIIFNDCLSVAASIQQLDYQGKSNHIMFHQSKAMMNLINHEWQRCQVSGLSSLHQQFMTCHICAYSQTHSTQVDVFKKVVLFLIN